MQRHGEAKSSKTNPRPTVGQFLGQETPDTERKQKNRQERWRPGSWGQECKGKRCDAGRDKEN